VITNPTAFGGSLAGSWTVEAWFYPTQQFGGSGNYQTIFWGGPSSGGGNPTGGVNLFFPQNQPPMAQVFYNGSNYQSPSVAIGTYYNRWYHMFVSFDSTASKLYIGMGNSLNSGTQTPVSSMSAISAWYGYRWTIGAEISTGGVAASGVNQGYISNFRISNTLRYGTVASYSIPVAAFVYDSNTVYLNSFNQTSGTNWAITELSIMPCLCTGMLIRTPYGDTPVEKLRVGDLVITQDGRTVPIVDTVRSIVRGDYYNIPFRIPAHHFAENAPYADVLISPNHIIYYGKVIVPCQASGLVDETALLGKDFEYFNIALPNYATDKMMCQGLEVDSWNTRAKLMY